MYDKIIPPKKLVYNKNIAERAVVADDLATLAYEWEPSVRKSATQLDTLYGASFKKDGLVAILNPSLAWEKLDREDREIYIEEQRCREIPRRTARQPYAW